MIRLYKDWFLRVAVGSLDGNHHGPGGSVVRYAVAIYPLGQGYTTRCHWGRRAYLYASDGRCWFVDVGFWNKRLSAERNAVKD